MTTLAGKRLAILMPQTWSVRNIVTSGLVDRLLDRGAHVTLLLRRTEGWQRILPAHERLQVLPILPPRIRRHVRGRALIGGILGVAFEHRNRTRSQKTAMRRFRRGDAARPGIRRTLLDLLGVLCQPAPIREGLMRLRLRLYDKENDLRAIHAQLSMIRPDILYSTVSIAIQEFAYIRAAQVQGIPTVSSILSFDNLTSRAELPVFHHYVVWNERMKTDLLRLYPDVAGDRIDITGTPQFDFHKRPDFLWSREETGRRLGLPDGARYILHAANSKHWTPTEPALVREFIERMGRDSTLRDLWIVVRLHPLDDFARWQGIADGGLRVVVSMPWLTPPDPDWWALIGADDQRLLVSTIAHAELCVNMCSTMSLDSAILDRPVVGLGFASVSGSPEEKIYREAYNLLHYRPLVESGGLRIAWSWESMLTTIKDYLRDPGLDREARRSMVATECGPVDGRAAVRIADALTSILLNVDQYTDRTGTLS